MQRHLHSLLTDEIGNARRQITDFTEFVAQLQAADTRLDHPPIDGLHIALAVDDLDATILDYCERLGADPLVIVPGRYALWRTEEVNLSVSCDAPQGQRLRHLGFEDDAVGAKTKNPDVNGLTGESFTAAQQDAEIDRTYGPLQ